MAHSYLLRRAAVRRRWRRAGATRRRLTSSPPVDLTRVARFAVTGLGAGTDLYQARDVFGEPWGFLHVPSTGHGSVVLSGGLPGVLDDAGRAEAWLARLGLWLAVLRYEPDLAACVVAVGRPSGPAPAGPGRDVRLLVQLTYRAAGPYGRRDPSAQATELAARLPELTRSLADVGRVAVAGSDDLRAAVLSAYGVVDAGPQPTGTGPGRGLARGRSRRPEARLLDVDEAWSHVRHGPGRSLVSTTWALGGRASAAVLPAVLPALLAIPPVLARVRVGLLATPSTHVPSAYDRAEWTGLSSQALGRPVPVPAEGESLPSSSTLVTATVSGPDRLADAAAAVHGCLTPDVRPWLRPVYGDQAAAFAAGLPLGVTPRRHALPPRQLVTVPTEAPS